MNRVEVGRIVVGRVYVFHLPCVRTREGQRVIEDVEFGRYRVEAFGFDGVTRAERVFYAGLEGEDRGKLYCCSPTDFALKLRPVEKPSDPVEEPPTGRPPEKVAGKVTEGSGV